MTLSARAVAARVGRVVPPAVIGACGALLLVLYRGMGPPDAEALSSRQDVLADAASISSGETYTAFLPSVFRCYSGDVPPFGVQFYGG